MKTLYNRKGVRRGGEERSQFAFFLTGALVLFAIVFVIGIQVGRVIEKNAAKKEKAAGKEGGAIVVGKPPAAEIGREIGSFSEEAAKLSSPPAPTPGERLRETERSVTFRETLERKTPQPADLVPPPVKKELPGEKPAASAPAERLFVQVAAFRDRSGADAMRGRLAKKGHKASIAAPNAGEGETFHRVLIGPYGDRDAATRAMRKIAAETGGKPFLVKD